ncbi:hypothetical protein EDD76_10279 [Kineothrix alysoides]|uniref:ABC transporter substrate-binding protein n=1 Tax=Kineothrix alysoides TaxID=1469948 RepID=A0A4R1R4I7_9FIRM|nr:DUF6062 family protein [Kineothrix alysoides]TCL60384.1 hypothetical protein EDD76_10279 [Kineothrix alysoides]
MKEKLYTIPLNDAVNANDECPFCLIERNVEQDLLDFVLGSGSSYMESDVRGMTDTAGFCRNHFKKMFDYGNTLGNGWILKTHYVRMNQEMAEQFKTFSPKKSFFLKGHKKGEGRQNPIGIWTEEKENSCYICKQFSETYDRYMDTFFILYGKDNAFREKIENSKGFCLHHFGDLCEAAESKLSDKEKTSFYPAMFSLMEKNMKRMADDVAWLVEKFDYRNKEADWKDSKDAIQRGMQKLKGGYPAAPTYKMNK